MAATALLRRHARHRSQREHSHQQCLGHPEQAAVPRLQIVLEHRLATFDGGLITDAEHLYRTTCIPQEHGTLELMLWATSSYWIEEPSEATQRHAVLQDREARRKQTQAATRREATTRQKGTQEQISQLGDQVEETEKRLAEAARRVEAAEQRAAAEARLTTTDKRLRAISRQVQEADDRALRALRIPARLKDALSRSRRDR